MTALLPLFESFNLSFFLMQCLPCFLQFLSTAIAVPNKRIMNTGTQYDSEALAREARQRSIMGTKIE